jgi:hypothetical protein
VGGAGHLVIGSARGGCGRWGFGGLAPEIFLENIEPKIFISEAILLVIFEL